MGIVGSDAEANTKFLGRISGYETIFSIVKNHILLEAELTGELKNDKEEVINFPNQLLDFGEDIAEVRIEGHTSSGWLGQSEDDAYILNMGLSQARTRSTLDYLLLLPEVQNEKTWLKAHMTANGLSSSKPVLDSASAEDRERSRRVEFRLRTDAESRIAAILQNQR